MARALLAAARRLSPGLKIEMLGFNCAPPEDINASLDALGAFPGLRAELARAGISLGAWANCNDRRAAHSKGFDVQTDKSEEIKLRDDLGRDGFAGYAQCVHQFVARGATMVGGCCGCGPQGIRAIRDTVIIRDRRDGSGE